MVFARVFTCSSRLYNALYSPQMTDPKLCVHVYGKSIVDPDGIRGRLDTIYLNV
jgi:hypothetical protein